MANYRDDAREEPAHTAAWLQMSPKRLARMRSVRLGWAIVGAVLLADCSNDQMFDDNRPSSVTLAVTPFPVTSPGCVHVIGQVLYPYSFGSPDAEFDQTDDGTCATPTDDDLFAPVYAVASGTVTVFAAGRLGLYFEVTADSNLTYTYDGTEPNPGITLGAHVTAGQQVGDAASFRLGVIDRGVVQPFLAPQRYPDRYLHARDPGTMYTGSLRALIDAHHVTSQAGSLAQDKSGTIAGNWVNVYGPTDTMSVHTPALALGFRLDPNASLPIIAYNNTGDAVGCICYVLATDPPFRSVTTKSGAVVYHLYYGLNPAPPSPDAQFRGSLSVQLVDDTHLRAELALNQNLTQAHLDSGADLFVR